MQNTAAAINPSLINGLYPQIPQLQLTQIDGFDTPHEFRDSNGTVWTLVKAANSGMSEIPDPQSVSITDYWNHEFPGSQNKIFIYVVEGIRAPKTARESACRILYSWFSTTNNRAFTPQMIRPAEWLIANVYAAGLVDARVSKLNALCRVKTDAPPAADQTGGHTPLIRMEDVLNDGRTERPAGTAHNGSA